LVYQEMDAVGLEHMLLADNRARCSLVGSKGTLNKGITYDVSMNVTLSLDDDLVKKVKKIAVDRDTTLTGMVRDYLRSVAEEDEKTGRKSKELGALERSFEAVRAPIGKRTWTRASLYERS